MKLDDVLNDPPKVHDWVPGQYTASGLPREAFQFIYDHIGEHSHTLETGTGISTVVFAIGRGHHTCINPDTQEQGRLRDYCAQRGISLEKVDFQAERSDIVLARPGGGPLDIVLIDGGHGFPTPFIDWFYTAERLKVGGYLIIDDVQVWTGRILKEFLQTEPEWRPQEPSGDKTVIFQKVKEYRPWKEWDEQPYVVSRSGYSLGTKVRKGLNLLRQGKIKTLFTKAAPSK